MRLVIGLSALLTNCGVAIADCDAVYKDAVRNRDFSENNWSSLNTLYDQLCTSSGEKRSSSWDASLSVVIEDLPIGMTRSGKDALEKTTNCCHYYHSYRYDASHKEIKTDDVVVQALSNYNVCKNIEARTGVVISNKFANPDSMLVNFDFKNPNTVLTIDGVLATNLTCRSNEVPHGMEVLGKNSKFEMKHNFVISCERTKNPKPDAAAAYAYLPASLAIGTDIDSYTLSVPADSIYNNQLASDATSKISGLQTALDGEISKDKDISGKLDNITKRLSNLNLTVTKANIGQFNPGGGMFGGCGTAIATLANQFCPTPGKATYIRTLTKGGGQCGYDEWIIACVVY